MADEGKPRFDIPWATLLPLVAALAGVIAQYRPLVSARPSTPSGKSIDISAAQDVDARLWQDPLVVAQKAKSQLDLDLTTRNVPADRIQRHELPALVDLFQKTHVHEGGRILLLAVMIDSGPYIEQAESRLRARQGVLEGLNESGFVPADSEHIGYVSATVDVSLPADHVAAPSAFLLPWERCKVDAPTTIYPAETKSAFVLWLPAASFSTRPLATFAELVRPFVEGMRADVDVRLIGPATSDGLRAIAREVEDSKTNSPFSPERADVLDGLAIVSARATAPAKVLLRSDDPKANASEEDLRKTIEESVVSRKRGGLHFQRTIKTDDVVLKALIGELRLRHVDVAAGDPVALLTEWDGEYGRSLERTFQDVAGTSATPQIRSFRYMHGIDGRLPGDVVKTPDTPQRAQTAEAITETTEGLDQSDFLRRLARQLKEQDRIAWQQHQPGVRAIGLLGSDVFDKLMILRALRPEFPDAIFFTNNYDAHFEREEDWSDVRNLVIASPFGGRLGEAADAASFQQKVAPFRDNNQTSMFFGTLVATGRLSETDLEHELARQPRLFELGRHGSQQLYRPADLQNSAAQKRAAWFRAWLADGHTKWPLALSALALFLLATWISLSIVDRRAVGGGNFRERLKRVGSSTAFLLICGVPLIVLAVGLFAQTGAAIEEPLAFFSGISIWPTEMLRLVGLFLAVHFMLKAWLDLRANEREITAQFFPKTQLAQRWRLDLGLRRWEKEHAAWLSDGATVPAEIAWAAYLQRNRFGPRFIRIGVLTLLYVVFAIAFSLLFPQIFVPARGERAFTADFWVLIATVLAMMVLTFYVVDAIRLNSNFIRILTRSATQWGAPLSIAAGRAPPLDPAEIARYYDISFVARRTEAVAPLIWYPLIVLAVALIARNSLFDHWTWPISLILIFTLNAGWAFGSAIFLRRSAEQLRSAAVHSLQVQRLKDFANPVKRPILDELIAEVRGIRAGAFAPLSEQPFIRAIIYPSGGIGLLAVAQRLLDIF
ncbi:MAG: hypothetical protein ACR2HH_09620 [Chthoniobacterales bacterium]